MSRATPDDQLKFLLSCVRHSNNGKIDFVEVAKECGVVSKGAAAKRYERLLKANGIHPNGGATEKPVAVPHTVKQKSRADITKAAAAKRRKIEGESFILRDEEDEDEDDFKSSLKHEPVESVTVKPEHDTSLQGYAYTHAERPPPPAVFHYTAPPPRLATPYPFALPPQPLMQHYRNPPPRQMQCSESSLVCPDGPTSTNFSATNQRDIASSSHSQPSVTEEQINSMFEEFCSQDLFKQSDFGLPASPPAEVSSRIDAQVLPPIAQFPIGPHLESEIPSSGGHTESPANARLSLRNERSEGNGDGFDNCILILD